MYFVPLTAELEEYQALRDVFGETLSDEFVDVMLTQLVSALRPGPWDALDEASFNAAIALIASKAVFEAEIGSLRPIDPP